jgi:hypothetical protein
LADLEREKFMLSNPSEFEVLLERYDDDPGICSKLLRTHAQSDPKTFLAYAQKAILDRPVSRALRFITGLAATVGLIEFLLDLYSRSRQSAIALAQKVTACDPRFDHALLEFLQRPQPAQVKEEQFFHMGLDILDVISTGDQLVAGVLKILKHPNPKVRSKAALFVGSRTQNLAWAATGTQDYDPRVRANVIESLYGLNSDFVVQMFRDNVVAENNRVAGNAVLGLYLLGHCAAIPLIYEMNRHPEPRFRNTAAWIMGRTGDPRFALAFSELLNDPDELVRAQAFKGLGEVKKAIRASEKRPQLKSAIVKAEMGDWSTLVTTVRYLNGQPVHGISPTSFIVKTGSKPVRSYVVDEYDFRNSLSVAFIMCLPEHNEAEAEARFVKAIQACNCLRRAKDRWAILKIQAKPAGSRLEIPRAETFKPRNKLSILNVDLEPETSNLRAPVATPGPSAFEYSATPAVIDAMLRENPIWLNESASDDAIAGSVLSSLLRVDFGTANPHLIFLADSPKTHLIPALSAKGADLGASVHVLAQSPAWDTEEVRQLVGATGGMHRSTSDNDALPEICADTYSSLLHHYRIGWQNGSGNLELDIYSESGKASASYAPGSSRTAEDRLTA